MKQNMRRLWLMVCLVFCLLALSACTAAEPEALQGEIADEITRLTVINMAEITSVGEDVIEEKEARALKEKNTAMADGLSSWKSVMQDTGEAKEVSESRVTQTEDGGYECVLTVQFANRKGEFKGFYEEDYEKRLLHPGVYHWREAGKGRHEYTYGHGNRIPGADFYQSAD